MQHTVFNTTVNGANTPQNAAMCQVKKQVAELKLNKNQCAHCLDQIKFTVTYYILTLLPSVSK